MDPSGARTRARGRCLCGSIRFAVHGPIRESAVACHCSSCRRFSGGLWIGTTAHRDHVRVERDDSLTWFESSPGARRGFCGRCGSSLFWEGDGEPLWSIAAGSLEQPTGLRLAVHSWTAESADYWSFDPGIPRKPGPSGLGEP